MGCVPAHEPVLPVRSAPTSRVPAIVGRLVLRGADDTGGLGVAGSEGVALTTSVRAENASALPAVFVAVTRTLLRPPTSSATGLYVLSVWPAIGSHVSPAELQWNH